MAPVYFELGWAVLSTICLANVLFGLAVVGIVKLTPVSSIPLVVSSAGAVANGLSYYVFYADYPVVNTAVASVFADILWMVQEAGNVFYSYAILSRIIAGRELRVFRTLFWAFMLAILVLRALIATTRARGILHAAKVQDMVNNLHMAYFTCIALVECVSAFFLLRKLASVRRSLMQASLNSSTFSHLLRSTETRVATLALIGGARAVTYYFQPPGQEAASAANQVDRFIYTFECMFPVMMFIDLLASKLAASQKLLDQRLPSIPPTWASRSERDELRYDGEPTSQTELGRRSRASLASNHDVPGHPMRAVLPETPYAHELRDVEGGRSRFGYGK